MQKMHPAPSSSTEVCWLVIKTVKPETVGQDVVALIKRAGKRQTKIKIEDLLSVCRWKKTPYKPTNQKQTKQYI